MTFVGLTAILAVEKLAMRYEMNDVAIFRAEQAAGIAELIKRSTTVACTGPARLVEPSAVPAHVSAAMRAQAGREDPDIHFVEAILVTAGTTNENGDHIDRVEALAARDSVVGKKVDIEHDDRVVVGSVTSCRLMDLDGNPIAEDAAVDELPAQFHLVVGMALWTTWQNHERQAAMDKMLDEVSKGVWKASMACTFSGHAFALTRNGTTTILPRTAETAHYSQALKAYGGTGVYGDAAVSRVLRNVIFGGVALTKSPANQHSVILQADTAVAVARWYEGRPVATVAEARPATKLAADILDYLTN
jgi:hypothetical protein